jgi:hypothetical protein
MRRLAIVAALASAAAFALIPAAAQARPSCPGGTRGDGTKVTETRQVAPFTAIRLEGSIDVAVKVGGAASVAVTIDRNLQPLVTTGVSGTTLVISTGEASWEGRGIVEVTVPALRALAIEGSGDVTVDGGQGDLTLSIEGSGDLRWSGAAAKLDASISGSGDLRLSGTAEQARLSVEGSGEVKAGGLTASSAEIEVEGSGDVEVTLDGGPLRARVSGSGDVVWHGRAVVELASVSGSGEIVRR